MKQKPTAPAAISAPVRLRRPDRMQVEIKIQCADELVAVSHPVRAVWDIVRSLDLSAFCAPIKARAGVCGRDATDPALLVSLWAYAAIRGIGSARELARLCQESRPYQWLCGGVTLNHHTLSDFRVGHGQALDDLFTQLIAVLVKKGLVKVRRLSQDGTRVPASAGTSSFRRGQTLDKLLVEAQAHVAALKATLDDPARSGGWSARQKAARRRAARERVGRIKQAIEQLPRLRQKQARRAARVAKKDRDKKLKEPRVSTTDPRSRIMKMGNGGFDAAVNVQLGIDTDSRAILGVEVVDEGTDPGQAEPMRQQVERRTGRKVEEHLVDGGYLVIDEIDRAATQGVTLLVPPPPARKDGKEDPDPRARYAPRPDDTPAVAAWRKRMGTDEAQAIYKQRASTVETANADLKTFRGLGRLTVRGLAKARCAALWSALAYNLLHFAGSLIG